jgi:hypothetical protein
VNPDNNDLDPLAVVAAELGDPDAVYAVSPARFWLKFGTAAGLLGYGLAANYLWWFLGPARFDHLVLLVLFGPPVWGLSILRHLAKARGLHVLVYPAGLLRVQGSEVESYPWAETDEVRVRSDHGEATFDRDTDGRMTACWVAVEPPLLKFWDAGLTMSRQDGAEATFTPALADYPALAERVQRGTFAARWPELLGRLRAGETVEFGAFEVSPDGVGFGKQWLPWSDVSGTELGQKNLVVKRRGKWLPWAATELAGVPNPHLLLAAVEEMRSRFVGPDEEPADE